MKTIKAKVIMLPTNDKPTRGSILLRHLWKDTKLECRSVWQYDETKQLSNTAVYTTLNGSFMDAPSSFKSQHVYLTTDEEIKEGDWFINDDGIWKCKNNIIPSGLNPRKIVATTDKSLKNGVCGNCKQGTCYDKYLECESLLPQIPQEFLKKYCETDGKTDEVEIEIELKSIPVNKEMPIAGYITYHDLKVDSNNCVIISKSKDSWSREEVENLLYKHTEMMLSGYRDTLDNWIKENL